MLEVSFQRGRILQSFSLRSKRSCTNEELFPLYKRRAFSAIEELFLHFGRAKIGARAKKTLSPQFSCSQNAAKKLFDRRKSSSFVQKRLLRRLTKFWGSMLNISEISG